MESKKETTYTYKVEDSASRMDDILDASDNDYSDNENNIPSRDKLTFKNGYYVDVTSIFIDIVDSSKLTDGHKRPTLAKMYRCFLSECVAIMNSYTICKEININGDCVWGVFETPNISDVDKVTDVAAQLNSMIRILNYKLGKKNYEKINVGIGIDDGLALMVKAGYSGSGLNDVIWMGDVVNSACHLANKAGRGLRKTILVSSKVYENVLENTQKLLSKCTIDGKIYYEGNFIWKEMENWYHENCK
ncbi:MAG TPA: adenylate/guanylate cyclase domain-containing protein [Candidatus Mediterraneibacter faecavium]|uniref:Adenylate/guanylate cyclase domain-containing protein n=1 Tax=Candidatus Mediterraneibacter faecavium TaxID=2838668 RepID=A0A9D2QAB3_9FIRM|nr:adenylate/guanylate cyclase domain-containing protein [Candidatus Mediterraneibacter faecavium]